jgi:hypothetical protein
MPNDPILRSFRESMRGEKGKETIRWQNSLTNIDIYYLLSIGIVALNIPSGILFPHQWK